MNHCYVCQYTSNSVVVWSGCGLSSGRHTGFSSGATGIGRLQQFWSEGIGNKELVVWQCQATATNLKDVMVYAAVYANAVTSPLLCTKKTLRQDHGA